MSSPASAAPRHFNQAGWMDQYRKKNALWVHNGDMTKPHAELTSGEHSSGFFNSELVMEDPMTLEDACADLLAALLDAGFDINGVDRVVGPAMGAITMAHELARQIGRRRGHTCLRGYTEKTEKDGQKGMAFKRVDAKKGERILVLEDVVTTRGSVMLTEAAVLERGCSLVPFVPVLVNRSEHQDVNGKPIVALIAYPMPKWDPAKVQCPLCAQGSKALRPKENWPALAA